MDKPIKLFEIIVDTSIYAEVEEYKNKTIKSIMRVVDSNTDDEARKVIRHAILDEVNDLYRRICERLDWEIKNKNGKCSD